MTVRIRGKISELFCAATVVHNDMRTHIHVGAFFLEVWIIELCA